MADDPIARRIKERRTAAGWSLAALAQRAGLRAPSFVHHIEAGQKIPSEEVAARLAVALSDDESLYRAWARARGRGDLAATREAIALLERRLKGDVDAQGAAPPIGPSPTEPASTLRVALLPEGADPGTTAVRQGRVGETLRLDPRLIAEPLFHPFAYRLTERGAARGKPRLMAGDLVVLTRNAWPVHREGLYAVRVRGETLLTRARWESGALVVAGHGDDPEETLPNTGTPPAALMGRVAAVFRTLGA